MKVVIDFVSVLVIVCLIGAMGFATRALKRGKDGKPEEKKENMKKAGTFFIGYGLLNILRLVLERNFL